MPMAIDLVRRGGRVLLAGLKHHAPVPGFVSDLVVLKSLRVLGGAGYTPASMQAAVDLIASGAVRTDLLAGAVFGLDEIEKVAPHPGEDVALSEEERRLGFADTLRTAAEQAREMLSAEQGGPDALGVVGTARRLLEGVRDHDPAAALWGGGDDGLDAIRTVERTARRLLRPGGHVAVEHSDMQGNAVYWVFAEEHGWRDVRNHRDLTDRDRFVTARLAVE